MPITVYSGALICSLPSLSVCFTLNPGAADLQEAAEPEKRTCSGNVDVHMCVRASPRERETEGDGGRQRKTKRKEGLTDDIQASKGQTQQDKRSM